MNFLLKQWNFLKTVIIEFFGEKSFFHGAALAYYAILALVPMLYLSITFFGRIVGHDTMVEIISSILVNQVGIVDVDGVLSILNQVDLGGGNPWLETVGAVALLFSCTAILNSLRRSINEFYNVDHKPEGTKKIIISTIVYRLISMLFILGITVLIIVLYFAQTVFLSLSNQFLESYGAINWFFVTLIHYGIPILMNAIIFAFVFKYLHNGHVKWKMAVQGAMLTSILLYLGQLLIKFYLSNYFFASNGGVAGTLLIILVWVYYSSQIIFLGAKYIAVRSRIKGVPVSS